MDVNSPTEGAVQTPASNEPTGQEAGQQQSAEQQNQDTNSGVQNTQGSVSDDTANQNQNQNGDGQQTQTQEKGGDSTTDDGLAKFAKSQGIEDLSQLTEREQKLLKVAHDNQKYAREQGNKPQPKVTDATADLGDGTTEARVAQLEYERTTDRFWSAQGDDGKPKYDRSLEGKMTKILYDKVEQLTPMLGEAEAKKYAFSLSRDLDTLYTMAAKENGAFQPPVDVEAIRREERESINKQLSAGAPNAHATQGGQSPAPKVTPEWITNEYDPRNPEHRKLVDEFYSQN